MTFPSVPRRPGAMSARRTAGQCESAPSSPTVQQRDPQSSRHTKYELPLRRTQSLELPSSTEHILCATYRDIHQHYVVGNFLGEGVSGSVKQCTHRSSGVAFACKSVLKSSLVSPMDVVSLRNEVKAMTIVGEHPAVVKLHDVLEDSKAVHLIMDLCEAGDLFDRIKQQKHFSERDGACICRILVSVLDHCNSKGVMHRDFKPENILMQSSDSHTAIKVADFGQAAFLQRGLKLKHTVGTGYYIAPEVLDSCYGPEADVWSIGVILYTLLRGMPPFFASDTLAVFAKIRAGSFDLDCGPLRTTSEGAKDLICQMLCMDPARRITPKEIKNHPWIQQHCGMPVVSVPNTPVTRRGVDSAKPVRLAVAQPAQRSQAIRTATVARSPGASTRCSPKGPSTPKSGYARSSTSWASPTATPEMKHAAAPPSRTVAPSRTLSASLVHLLNKRAPHSWAASAGNIGGHPVRRSLHVEC